MDFILRIKPPNSGEILFEKIRTLLYKLRELGLNIKWVTFDTFQSVDMIQTLQQKRFMTGVQSMDTSTDAYDLTKTALMDGRLDLPEHDTCYKEFIGLEKDAKKNKIDHRPNGSKDCSDAVAGVVTGLTLRRTIWIGHRISVQSIPQSVLSKENKSKNSVENRQENQQTLEIE